ncbi:MarR family transcriptional regulator [Sphaerisporangium sp. NPDC051017]|uniref:MarR family winged helix-turn-helix transcriptional regulator n=1 Tax=Sphaerisporangium sp. NPDC051017 TaxID=3154636 RepID=UPI003436D3A4
MQDPTRSDPLRLDDQVCFALHAACRALDDVYRRELRELGLTYPQYLVMLALWDRPPDTPDGARGPGEGLSVKQLGAALRLDSGTLSPLLKRLEAAGLIRRARDPRDERSVRVLPTAEGTALRGRAAGVPGRIAAATGLPGPELISLRQALRRLTATLDSPEDQPGAPPGASSGDAAAARPTARPRGSMTWQGAGTGGPARSGPRSLA